MSHRNRYFGSNTRAIESLREITEELEARQHKIERDLIDACIRVTDLEKKFEKKEAGKK